jgi:uncharacterized membrane protein YphA (DoxX/SURF4 family)
MEIGLWIAQVLLALVYGMAGSLKTFKTAQARERMVWTQGRSDNYVHFVGITELLGALGMLLPMLTGILPWLTPLAALGLALIQALAIFMEHLPKKDYKALPMNVVLLAVSLVVLIGRWPLMR